MAMMLTAVVPAAGQLNFDYDRRLPLDVKETGRREQGGALKAR